MDKEKTQGQRGPAEAGAGRGARDAEILVRVLIEAGRAHVLRAEAGRPVEDQAP